MERSTVRIHRDFIAKPELDATESRRPVKRKPKGKFHGKRCARCKSMLMPRYRTVNDYCLKCTWDRGDLPTPWASDK